MLAISQLNALRAISVRTPRLIESPGSGGREQDSLKEPPQLNLLDAKVFWIVGHLRANPSEVRLENAESNSAGFSPLPFGLRSCALC